MRSTEINKPVVSLMAVVPELVPSCVKDGFWFSVEDSFCSSEIEAEDSLTSSLLLSLLLFCSELGDCAEVILWSKI